MSCLCCRSVGQGCSAPPMVRQGGCTAWVGRGQCHGSHLLSVATRVADHGSGTERTIQHRPWHFEGAPDPGRAYRWLFHLNLTHPAVRICHHRIEELGTLDREEEKRQRMIVQGTQAILWKPDRVRETDHHRLLRLQKRQGPEDRIAQA